MTRSSYVWAFSIAIGALVVVRIFWGAWFPDQEVTPAAGPTSAQTVSKAAPAAESPDRLPAPKPRTSAQNASPQSAPAPKAARVQARARAKVRDEPRTEATYTGPAWIHDRYQGAQKKRDKLRNNAEFGYKRPTVEELAQIWAIEFELQEEVGHVEYDRLLYEIGRKNRVKVGWVTPGSNAMVGGLMRGDIIVAYDGYPAYSVGGVRQRNREASKNTPIVVEYIRDGALYETSIEPDRISGTRGGHTNGMRLDPFAEDPNPNSP